MGAVRFSIHLTLDRYAEFPEGRVRSAGILVEESSGNVFADLGLPNADELMLKARLAHKITILLEERGLTQAEAARILGTQQPRISQLVRGALGGFSLERLIRYLNVLGRDVEIVVHEQSRPRGSATVTVAG